MANIYFTENQKYSKNRYEYCRNSVPIIKKCTPQKKQAPACFIIFDLSMLLKLKLHPDPELFCPFELIDDFFLDDIEILKFYHRIIAVNLVSHRRRKPL